MMDVFAQTNPPETAATQDSAEPSVASKVTPNKSLLEGMAYEHSSRTDLLSTFKKMGWQPPSGQKTETSPEEKLMKIGGLLEGFDKAVVATALPSAKLTETFISQLRAILSS